MTGHVTPDGLKGLPCSSQSPSGPQPGALSGAHGRGPKQGPQFRLEVSSCSKRDTQAFNLQGGDILDLKNVSPQNSAPKVYAIHEMLGKSGRFLLASPRIR